MPILIAGLQEATTRIEALEALVQNLLAKQMHQRSFGGQVQRAVQRGLGWASTAKGMYELGKGLYTAGRYIAPIVAGLL